MSFSPNIEGPLASVVTLDPKQSDEPACVADLDPEQDEPPCVADATGKLSEVLIELKRRQRRAELKLDQTFELIAAHLKAADESDPGQLFNDIVRLWFPLTTRTSH